MANGETKSPLSTKKIPTRGGAEDKDGAYDEGPTTKPEPPRPPVQPPPAVAPESVTDLDISGSRAHEVRVLSGGQVVGRMIVKAVKRPGVDQDGHDDQWDTGVFEIKDGFVVVGRLWVKKNVDGSKTEHWGLSASYQWPGANNASKTFQYNFLTGVSYGSEQAFKDDCNNNLFPNTVVTFLKDTPVSF